MILLPHHLSLRLRLRHHHKLEFRHKMKPSRHLSLSLHLDCLQIKLHQRCTRQLHSSQSSRQKLLQWVDRSLR